MIEKNIEDYKTNKGVILKLSTNEFCIYNREKHKNKIIGFYTDGIANCSAVIISINNDDFLFFSHINEESNIIEVVKNKIINKINLKNNSVTIIYSIGIGSIKNMKKEDNIKKMIELFDTKFNLKVIQKNHDLSISCLKIIKTLNNDNNLLFKKLINFKESSLEKNLNSKKKFSDFIKKTIDLFKESIFREYNLVFYFDCSQMESLAKHFNFIIL